MPMSVFVAAAADGSAAPVDARGDMTVAELAAAAGLPPGTALVFQGEQLTDPAVLLADAGIGSEAVVSVLPRPHIADLEARVAALPSPGCECQKYLRYLQGVPAGDPRVLQTLRLVSFLAASAPEKRSGADPMRAGHEADALDEVAAAALIRMAQVWGSPPRHHAPRSPAPALRRAAAVTADTAPLLAAAAGADLDAVLEPHYAPAAHARLLEWAAREGPAPHGELPHRERRARELRVAMAEVRQIECRDARRFVESAGAHRLGACHSRQVDAFVHLLRIAAVDHDRIHCWA